MNDLRTVFFFTLSTLIGGIAAKSASASDEMATVQTLNDITAQSSEIPALLTGKTIDLPPAVVEKPAKSKPAKKAIHAEIMNASKSPISISVQENSALQKKLVDTQKQLDSVQQQWKDANQQLEEKAQQLEQLRSTQKVETTAASDLKKSQVENQKQIDALKAEISVLTAAQVTNQLELAAAKTRDSQDVLQLKKSLADAQDQRKSLIEQIATLTASQMANTKALDAAKSGNVAAVETLKQSLIKRETESTDLKKSLANAQSQATALNKQVAELTAEKTANANVHTAAKADADKVIAQLKTSLTESQAQTTALNKQVESLQSASEASPISTTVPESADQLRAYSLGTLWGQEIRGALANVQSNGFTPDLKQVVSGVSDSIRGEFKIPKEKIMAQLDSMNKQVLASQQKTSETTENEGDKFITDFSKQAGVKQSEMGYYYRVLDAGRGKIKPEEVVSVSVKESLSNGNVIKDMAKTKQVVTLPAAQFPPVFATSIALVGSHGKVQIVVPPELAYGDRGQPPQIPPKSTMVYEITVQDVKPGQAK
jgi:FKBP-type peptidyl-prolyl cis-trans isomerase